jgi:DNA-binding LacI/PurR family transcriptional regulator
MAATIKDIAKKLNISTSTVSYALNGGPRSVPEEIRIKVLETAKELQYRPNRLARSLITRRSHTIGVVPTAASVNLAYTPYFQGVVNGILNEAEKLEQDVLIFTRYDARNPEALADSLLDGRVDGAVFLAPVRRPTVFEVLDTRAIPFVVLSGDHPEAPVFHVDNRQGAKKAVQHLVELGHSKIAHIVGSLDMDDAVERREGYLQAMREFGLCVPPNYLIQGDFTTEGGYQAGLKLMELSEPPTAVFCANDETAAGVVQAARTKGVPIPQALSIVGFDNAPISAFSYPPLTTVSQPWEEMSREALRTLLRMVEGESYVPGSRFSTELLVRSSTTSPMEDPSK